MAVGISVVIPSYNPPRELLARLHASLCAQTWRDFEVIVVDDASNEPPYDLLEDPRFRVVYRERNAGPAVCRNAGAAEAESEYLFFTDTDCELAPDTLRHAVAHLAHENATMGNTITRTESVFGKAVALLGFPGGGCIGFDRVWRVDADGYTNSFSSCNLGFRRRTFEELGGFRAFPVAGGEDTVLAREMADSGMPIRYVPEQVVYHVEKSNLRDFVRWQITRGRGNYYIRQNVPEVGGYLRLRVWTFKNSLVAGPLYAPLVLPLIGLSVHYQLKGMRQEARRAETDGDAC